jgi:hypothetical protein
MDNEESILDIDQYGTKLWRNKIGLFHRLEGPAIEYKNGNKFWFQNGRRHRIDGPAAECEDGAYKAWYQNGELHRLDGPAIEDGSYKPWYIMGKKFHTKEAFFEALTDEEKEIALFSEDFHNA